MIPARTLDIYLDGEMLVSARRGTHNYMNRIAVAFSSRGIDVRYRPNDAAARLASVNHPGYSLFHMDEPMHKRALTTRRAYFYPFWRIEATAERWNWRIAKAAFDPETVDSNDAQSFFRFWRKRLFSLTAPPGPGKGFVYVPLQGRLDERRSFQAASPLKMIRTAMSKDPTRPLVLTLHPKETYSEHELAALHAMVDSEPRLQLSNSAPVDLLASCDYVVTQNSAIALAGFFFERPAVLFAEIDFHHIAGSVPEQGELAAFQHVGAPAPDYARYLYWFLQLNAINAGRDEAEAQILAAVRGHGWDV